MRAIPGRSYFPTLISKETVLDDFPAPSRRALPVFVGYPSTYRVGMSNLGFHFILGRLRKLAGLRVERFFTDTAPRTLESAEHISRAPFLLFSVSYEEDYLSLIRILQEAGIEPLREARRREPCVVVGGPAVSANSFPLHHIVDAAVLGEGERPLGRIADLLAGGALTGDELLEALAGEPGVLLPGKWQAEVSYAPDAGAEELPHSVIVTPEAVFGDMLLVESGRGCPGSCTFCLATALYRPCRSMPLGAFSRLLERVPPEVKRVGLVSTAVAAHPHFQSMVRLVTDGGREISFSSLRIEDLDEGKIALIGSVGTRSVSIAPESGSERIRFGMGKRVPDNRFFETAAELVSAGIGNLTIYLLTGCPGEDGRSREETKRFLEQLKRARAGRPYAVHVNTLVPKAWTPLQFHSVPEKVELEKRIAWLRGACIALGLPFRAKSIRSSLRQAFLSLAGEEAGRALVSIAGGSAPWKKALREAGCNPALPHGEKGMDTPFPWDRLRGPLAKEALFRRYRRLSATVKERE